MSVGCFDNCVNQAFKFGMFARSIGALVVLLDELVDGKVVQSATAARVVRVETWNRGYRCVCCCWVDRFEGGVGSTKSPSRS